MKLTNINNTVSKDTFEFAPANQRIVEIEEPISTALQWHQLSKWRSAKRLRAQYPALWEDWKRKKLIPDTVIARVELG